MHSRQRKSYLVNFEYFTDEISNHRGQHHQEAHQPAVTGNQLCSGGFLCIKIYSIIKTHIFNFFLIPFTFHTYEFISWQRPCFKILYHFCLFVIKIRNERFINRGTTMRKFSRLNHILGMYWKVCYIYTDIKLISFALTD